MNDVPGWKHDPVIPFKVPKRTRSAREANRDGNTKAQREKQERRQENKESYKRCRVVFCCVVMNLHYFDVWVLEKRYFNLSV